MKISGSDASEGNDSFLSLSLQIKEKEINMKLIELYYTKRNKRGKRVKQNWVNRRKKEHDSE